MLTMDNEQKSIEDQEASLYDILNISKDAKQTEIKKGFSQNCTKHISCKKSTYDKTYNIYLG